MTLSPLCLDIRLSHCDEATITPRLRSVRAFEYLRIPFRSCEAVNVVDTQLSLAEDHGPQN